ncbi:Uncharacterised protein [BD1-7 clade bacterium]|uniref:Lipoprotein n=1 Tax=BD1-7 clade bacterium TaxID=2029982 RepID=A0A5S9QJE4_9GAMM|nr:Uncharacterised protein [BD1-7 clade bacterium]
MKHWILTVGMVFFLSACDSSDDENNDPTEVSIVDSWVSEECLNKRRSVVVFWVDEKSIIVQTNQYQDAECTVLDKALISSTSEVYRYSVIGDGEMYISKIEVDVVEDFDSLDDLDVHDGSPELVYFDVTKERACFSNNVSFSNNTLTISTATNPEVGIGNCYVRD